MPVPLRRSKFVTSNGLQNRAQPLTKLKESAEYSNIYTHEKSMKNFRLLFLENINPLANDMMSVDFLYETNIENYNKSDQCFLFEKLISDIVLIPFEGDSNSNRQYFVRFIGFKHPKLYF